MKTNLLIVLSLMTFATLVSFSARGQGATEVKSRATDRQLKSMVFMKWDKQYFRPQWYYWLFHNRYRKGQDRRTLLQLLPAAAFLHLNEDKAEEQQAHTDEIGRQELWTYINYTANAHYHLIFKARFESLAKQFAALIAEGKSSGMESSVRGRLQQEQERLEDEVTIIREGYMNEGIKSEEFLRIAQEMESLQGLLTELVHVYRIRSRYQPSPL